MTTRIPLVWSDTGQTIEELPAGDTVGSVPFFNVVTVTTTPYNVTNEGIIFVDTTVINQDITINLPSAASRFSSGFTEVLWIKNISGSGTKKAIIVPFGTEEIDGSTSSINLNKFNSLSIATDGSNWWVL